jgi:fucose permease
VWFGTWAIYIPYVQDKLGIDKAELGVAIFCLSLGVFTVFPFASRIINRIGVGRSTEIGVYLCSVFALFPLIAPGYWSLCISLFLLGLGNGFTDIAMNTLVSEIEIKDKKHIMSAAHGFFSLGGVLVGLGSFLVPKIDNPPLHMGISVVIVLVINLFLFKHYRQIKAPPIEKNGWDWNLLKPLFLLSLIAFVAMGSEGAIIDWSSLYLKEVTLARAGLIGSGFLAFSVAMTLGRFLGDGISQRMGSYRLLALGAVIAILGFALVLSGVTLWALIGFALTGLGYSVMVPELFRIGGKVPGVDSAQGISFIAGSGYTGFMLGPVLLGFIAEFYSLNATFATLLGITALILLLSLRMQATKK